MYDTPFTPAIGIIVAMKKSLDMIKEKGLPNTFAHYAKLAKATRAAAKALGLNVFAQETCVSNALTAIILPATIDGEKLVKTMRDVEGITMAGGQDQLKGKAVRIAHMGCITEEDTLAGLACLEKVLKQMGYQFAPEAGVNAAREVFGMLTGKK